MNSVRSNIPAAVSSIILLSGVAHGAITLTPSRISRIVGTNNITFPAASIQVGELSTGASVVVIFDFTINTSTAADIAAASQITFSITPTLENGTGPTISLFALDADNSTSTSENISSAGKNVSSFTPAQVRTAITTGTSLVFDITSVVKADANGGFSSFRLETIDETTGSANNFIFGTVGSNNARLNVIPEPATSLLALASAAFLFRRRRKI